ncbi:DUF4124 domain-containing protein [Methylomonas methanica]|uniref:DUF4124 domain-containing protein n=1 Tax=Methylomonas methanica (strain DSM 25384 / MC09) TaxID=857087 RepID=F9ZYP2_METMM|nr:DUF4124 domain-containing protein [Methylomonas methanica]AEF98588.1 hypothetical protein Metme_0138 [Methylomonas methanica MC09]
MKNLILLFTLCWPFYGWAGVYKCTDSEGRTDYQSSPCTEERKAVQINTKTGSKVDLNELENRQVQATEQQKQIEAQKQAEEQARLDAIAERKQLARAQSDLTLALIKSNPMQFSAFAIPPYDPDNLPPGIRVFETRLPDIEKFRRLAAQKALATGKCQRVEADELNAKSTKEQLVFLVNCSSGASYYYNEAELKE